MYWTRYSLRIMLSGLALLFLLAPAISTLSSNLALVGLMEILRNVPPVRPAEVVGIGHRAQMPILAPEDVSKIRCSQTRAKVLALTGNIQAAEEVLFESGETRSSQDAFWLALIYAQQGRVDQMTEALQMMPEAATYFAQAGFEEWQRGHHQLAVQLLRTSESLGEGNCVTLPHPSYVYRILTEGIYHELGDWEMAVNLATCWVDARPTDPDAYIRLASLYISHNEYERGYAVLERGQAYGVQEHRLYPLQVGKIHQGHGDWRSAIQLYQEAWERNQNHAAMVPYVAWYLGFAFFHTEQFEHAQEYLEIVQETAPRALRKQAIELLERIESNN